MDDTDTIVSARGLNHWFGTGDARKQALHDIDLTLHRGSFTAFVGPSGSGKTTVLTLLGCLRAVQDGHIRLLGHDLHTATEPQRTTLRRRLGFIFQAHNLHKSLTAVQNVELGLAVHPGVGDRTARQAAIHMLGLLGLSERVDYKPDNLSGGQKQRVAIARALVSSPALVLADEPTAALDADSALGVIDLMKRMGADRGTTTLLVTHDPRILDHADRILSMEDGRIVKTQAPAGQQ